MLSARDAQQQAAEQNVRQEKRRDRVMRSHEPNSIYFFSSGKDIVTGDDNSAGFLYPTSNISAYTYPDKP